MLLLLRPLKQGVEHHPRKILPEWNCPLEISESMPEVLIVEFESISDDCLEGSSFVVVETVAARPHLRQRGFKVEFLEKKVSQRSRLLDQRIAEHRSPHLRRQVSAPVLRESGAKQHGVRPGRP